MSPRACQPTRKKILIWSKDRTRETEIADWLHSAGYETVVYPDVHDIVAVCAAETPSPGPSRRGRERAEDPGSRARRL